MSLGDGVDKARWPVLSPLLDELLDLDEAGRAARLQALQADDPELADELVRCLGQLQDLDHTSFMEAPALDADVAELGAAGRRAGPYTLERELGRGGMGSVWLARRTDGVYEGQVAIKFLQASLFGLAAGERFGREGRILGRLSHPNIARLLDAGHLGGDGPGAVQPYLVLEYVAGEPIDAWCDARQPDLAHRLALFLDVLAAVEHAHNHLILHRDLKPSNILVDGDGRVKLLDFGIAKLLDDAEAPTAASELTRRAGQAFTPDYAAPEQFEAGDVTTATDVYALGVLLYRLLAGRLPGESRTATAAVAPLLEAPLRRLSDAARRSSEPALRQMAPALRGDLDIIVAKALKPVPAERYANAADLAADLRRHLAHEPIQARPDRWAYRSSRFLRRHRLGVGAAALVLLAVAGGGIAAALQAREAQQQQAQAEGLIEFMLGDLPSRLKPVGRLDALDAVGERALAYYAAQDPSRLDAASLGRRARALHLLGEIEEQRGRLDGAARRFEEAEAATAALAAQHPDDPQHLFEHSQSAYWVGFIARRRGQTAQAEAAFGRYLALSQALVRRDPANLDWQTERAFAIQNLGVLRLEGGRVEAALQDFRETLTVWQGIVGARPALQLERANTFGWIARAQASLQDHGAATQSQRDKLEALARVPDAARDREVAYLEGNSHVELSSLHLAQGDAEAARAAAAEAQRRMDELIALDPDNQLWLSQAVASRLAHVNALLALGRRDEARALQSTIAQPMRRMLAVSEPSQHTLVTLQGRWLRQRALLEPGPATTLDLERYLAAIEAREAAGQPLDGPESAVAAGVGLAAGELALARRDVAGAQAAFAAAQRRLQPALARDDAAALVLHGLLALRRDDLAGARHSVAMLRDSSYRHPDRQLLQAGLARQEATRR